MVQISTPAAIAFIITTVLTVFFLYKATKSIKTLIIISLWMILTTILAFKGFYSETKGYPPHFIFLIAPGVLFAVITGIGKSLSKDRISTLLKWLTILHIIRIPVELLLFCLYKNGEIPHLMTFEGYNFDIISGITAPIIYYFIFIKKALNCKYLLGWNIICLTLLINIVSIAILSAPTPFQKLAFNQPNIGVTYFPYVWLPAIIVPVVLYSHIISIKQLLKSIK
ncbi:hypothetical protein [Flavobacterium sp. C4GT6]|uniref:hypothetical protein n=1 Tax=Flavobacterium sp. C4GT6 TaxID=3103818 RepID=UPI002ED5B936